MVQFVVGTYYILTSLKSTCSTTVRYFFDLVQIVSEHLKPRSMILEWVSPKENNIIKHEIKMMPKEEFDKYVRLVKDFSIDSLISALEWLNYSYIQTMKIVA